MFGLDPQLSDLTVAGVGLEEAFLALTGGGAPQGNGAGPEEGVVDGRNRCARAPPWLLVAPADRAARGALPVPELASAAGVCGSDAPLPAVLLCVLRRPVPAGRDVACCTDLHARDLWRVRHPCAVALRFRGGSGAGARHRRPAAEADHAHARRGLPVCAGGGGADLRRRGGGRAVPARRLRRGRRTPPLAVVRARRESSSPVCCRSAPSGSRWGRGRNSRRRWRW